jgi:hypothetical protein
MILSYPQLIILIPTFIHFSPLYNHYTPLQYTGQPFYTQALFSLKQMNPLSLLL